jgi:hypothetical protein
MYTDDEAVIGGSTEARTPDRGAVIASVAPVDVVTVGCDAGRGAAVDAERSFTVEPSISALPIFSTRVELPPLLAQYRSALAGAVTSKQASAAVASVNRHRRPTITASIFCLPVFGLAASVPAAGTRLSPRPALSAHW